MPIVYKADGTPIEMSDAEYEKNRSAEDSLSARDSKQERLDEAEIFEKNGWKKWNGLSYEDFPPTFENKAENNGGEQSEDFLDLPNSDKVDLGTKFILAVGDSTYETWYAEGQSKLPDEINTPLIEYRVYEARNGQWELVEERRELQDRIRTYPLGHWQK